MSYLSKISTSRIFNDAVNSNIIADGSIVDADISATAAIALSKLATNPLARANHTGTQLRSTISDFAHQATHIRGAGDEIDGDKLDVDFVPSFYTRTVTGPFSTNAEELASHLKGIDNALGTGGTFVYTVTTEKQVAYQILATDKLVRVATDAVGAGFTVTLPDASLLLKGHWVTIKDIGGACFAKPVTIQTFGAQGQIDKQATHVIDTNFGSVTLVVVDNVNPVYNWSLV